MEDESTKHTKKRDALLECSMIPDAFQDNVKNLAQHHNNVTQVTKELNMVVEGFRQITKNKFDALEAKTKAKFDVTGAMLDRLEKEQVVRPLRQCGNLDELKDLVKELKKTVHQLSTESRTQRNDIEKLNNNFLEQAAEITRLKSKEDVRTLPVVGRSTMTAESTDNSRLRRLQNIEDNIKALNLKINELEKNKGWL